MSDLMAVEKVKVISFQGWGGVGEKNLIPGMAVDLLLLLSLSWNVWEARDTWSDWSYLYD